MQFKKTAVVAATTIPLGTLNRWDERKIIKTRGADTKAAGKGRPRKFSLARVHEIAIGHALTKLHVGATAAMEFAALLNEPQHGRPIGGLFPIGQTVLLIAQDGTATIQNVQPDSDVDSLLTEANVVVNLDAIIARVNLRLLSHDS
jgi:hypothetical protein